MSYYTTAFKDICEQVNGEAMSTRIRVRLNNGRNLFPHSNDFLGTWSQNGTLFVSEQSLPGNIPTSEVADHTAFAVSSGTDTDAGLYKTLAYNYPVWFVQILAMSPYPTGASQGATAIEVRDEDHATPSSTVQYAKFTWADLDGESQASLDSSSGVIAAGAQRLNEDWQILWAAGYTDGNGGTVGNNFRFNICCNYGSSDVFKFARMGQASLDPARTATTALDGPYAPVVTNGTAIEYGGAPGQLIDTDSGESVISVNPVAVRREYEYGVVEAQQWQASFTNVTLALSQQELQGCFIALEGGFRDADEWALLAQGQINSAKANTDMRLTVDVDDPLRKLLDAELSRDEFWTYDEAWVSEIKDESRDDNSKSYDNTAGGITVVTEASIVSLEYKLVFTSTTAFKVTDEDGNEYTGFTKSADATVNDGTNDLFTISYLGWDVDAAAYASGDTFVFYTSKKRSDNALILDCAPLRIVPELLSSEKYLNLKAFDVITGIYYDDIKYDSSGAWATAHTNSKTIICTGLHTKGTRVIKMIQDILLLTHGGIYSMPSGQLAIYEARPNEVSPVPLNGDFDEGPVQILSGEMIDERERVYNKVRYEYLHIDGSEGQYTVEDTTKPILTDRVKVLKVSWRVNNSGIIGAAGKAMSRLKTAVRRYKVRSTLHGAVIDVNQPVSFNEPLLGVNTTSMVVGRKVDIMSNEAELELSVDDFVLDDYARVTDSEGNTIGLSRDGDKVAPNGGPYTGYRKVF